MDQLKRQITFLFNVHVNNWRVGENETAVTKNKFHCPISYEGIWIKMQSVRVINIQTVLFEKGIVK